jgi:hypothetical protein
LEITMAMLFRAQHFTGPMAQTARRISQTAKRSAGLQEQLALAGNDRLANAKAVLQLERQHAYFGLPGCLSKTEFADNRRADAGNKGLREAVVSATAKQLDSAKANLEKPCLDGIPELPPWRLQFGLPGCHPKATPKLRDAEAAMGFKTTFAMAAEGQLESAKSKLNAIEELAPWRRSFGLPGCLVKSSPTEHGSGKIPEPLHGRFAASAEENLKAAKATTWSFDKLPIDGAPWRRSFGLPGCLVKTSPKA